MRKFNKQALLDALRSDCSLGLVGIFKRHGKLIEPDGNGGWTCEKKRGWNVSYNGKLCSFVFSSHKKAREFIGQNRNLSPVIIHRE